MQLTQGILTAVKFFSFLCERWREEFKDPAWGWVRIVYHSAEFYKAMCTIMACRAGNYYCSLGSLFIIPYKYTGVSVRVTIINSLEVVAAILHAAWLQLCLPKLLAREAKLRYCYFQFIRKLNFYSCSRVFWGLLLGFFKIIFKAIPAINSKYMESALSSFSHIFCLNFDSFSILMLLVPIDFILGPFDFILFCCNYLAVSANSAEII